MDPFTMLILASAALGANVAHNKDQNVLEGALKGAALGATGGTVAGVTGAPSLPFFATPTPTTMTGAYSPAADPITGVLAQETRKGAIAALEQSAAPNIFQRAGTKLLATAKDKPLETAYFASTVGSALSPPPVTGGGAAPFTPGSVQPTPTVDESIGEMPMFVPKPLFDDMMGRSPEEMMLLEQQMMQRGLV